MSNNYDDVDPNGNNDTTIYNNSITTDDNFDDNESNGRVMIIVYKLLSLSL